jgi:hypothetical protein
MHGPEVKKKKKKKKPCAVVEVEDVIELPRGDPHGRDGVGERRVVPVLEEAGPDDGVGARGLKPFQADGVAAEEDGALEPLPLELVDAAAAGVHEQGRLPNEVRERGDRVPHDAPAVAEDDLADDPAVGGDGGDGDGPRRDVADGAERRARCSPPRGR